MRKYRPSNRTPIASIFLLLILGIICAGALGGILWAVDNYLNFYLVVAFPLLAGALAGGLLVLGVRSGKVRSPFLAALIGLLTGVLIFGVYHFATYSVTFRGAVRDVYVEDVGKTPSDAELDQYINKGLQRNTGDTGFIGYLKFAAQQGMTITNSTSVTSSSAADIELKDQWVWVYWGIELLLAGGIAASLAAGEARQPFDEDSNSWYGAPTTLALATLKARKPLDKALNDGDFQTAGSLLTVNNIRYPRNEILLRRGAATG
ncbi:MAG: hypothetical protein GC204_01635 [Chloroflexi bacterium]|nr:hypothetical protein [Chloroflexota bacterium]